MAKSVKKKSRKRDITAAEIFEKWTDGAKDGLGFGKKFSSDIFDEYESRLLDSIQLMLDNGEVFDKEAEKNTKAVAKDTGKICRMFTEGKTVSKDTFDLVFDFVRKNHPICPAGGGAGGWCEI
jgi:hypothetical protein